MSLEIVQCSSPSLECFLQELRSKGLSDFVSLEDFCTSPTPSSVVVGKLKAIHEYKPNEKLTFVAKEVLPDLSYGSYFFVVIEGFLLEPLKEFNLQRGDRVAFRNPADCYGEDSMKFGKVELSYSIRHGEYRSDMMWCARKDFTNPIEMPAIQSPLKSPSQNNLTGTTTNSRLENNKSPSPVPCEKRNSTEATSQSVNGNQQKSSETDGAAPAIKSPAKFPSQNNLKGTTTNSTLKNIKSPSPIPCKKMKIIESTSQKVNVGKQKSNETDGAANRPIKPVNPNYSYQTLDVIKKTALDGCLVKVNTFCVVRSVLKPLSRTKAGKFTIIIEAVDETLENDDTMKIHFFLVEDTLLKQVSQGDVLRLHRLQMEVFENEPDGRIFNSPDITLFKRNDSSNSYISVAKKILLTESENMKAKELKTWFQEKYIKKLLSNVVTLSEITGQGSYKLFCKIVKDPYLVEECLKLRVSDGSVITNLSPALSLEEAGPSLVTEISVKENQRVFETIKMNDYVLFSSVDVDETNCLTMNLINGGRNKFVIMEINNSGSLEVERKIEQNRYPPDEEADVEDVSRDINSHIYPSPRENTNPPTLNETKPISSNKEQIPNNKENILRSSSRNENFPGNEMNAENQVEESELNNSQGVARKTLFTANNGDWSDATEENSPPPLAGDVPQNNSPEVLLPVDKSMSNLFELLKDQYCSPRKLANSQRTSAKDSTSGKNTSLSSAKDTATTSTTEQKSTKHNVTLHECAERTLTSMNQVSTDDQDDVITVINKSFQQSGASLQSSESKEKQLEDESIVASEPFSPIKKVSSWLQTDEEDLLPEDEVLLSMDSLKTMLVTEEDFSSFIQSPIVTIYVFVQSINPPPYENPLDLLSGYCSKGCKCMYIFSTIKWERKGADVLPLCPACSKLGKSMLLNMVFMFELVVFDIEGTYRKVLVCREQAETFLNCTVENFVKEISQRERCTRVLNFLTQTYPKVRRRAKIALSLTFVKNHACLVETKLNLLGPNSRSVR